MDEARERAARLEAVTDHFALGVIVATPQERHGGVNRVWRLRTDRGDYAVHALLAIPTGVDPIERCQRVHLLEVAAQAAGVRIAPPVAAPHSGRACAVLGRLGPVVVHRWVDATPVHIDRTPASLYGRLGRSLALVHGVDANLVAPSDDLLQRRATAAEWTELAERAGRAGWPWALSIARAADELEDALQVVDGWDRSASEPLVYSHRDLTADNILDDCGEPVLIDWEDAGLIAPGNEIGRTALDNLGREGGLDPAVLGKYLRAYHEVSALPAVGRHWCSLWVRGLILYALHCAESCVTATASRSLLEQQSVVLDNVAVELRRRLGLVDALVEAFEAASPRS